MAELELALAGRRIAAEREGEGPALVLAHGLSATRRQVVHGSRALPRAGFEVSAYDARGHGSSDPAPPGGGYSYPELVDDLAAVCKQLVGEGKALLAGHSMGAHTVAAYALAAPDRVAGVALIGPAYGGVPPEEEELERWDRLADGLEQGGVDGFIRAYEGGLDPEWRETIVRFTRARLERHRHPRAVAQALREVPRSAPLEGLAELEFLEPPALVVASHDDADPGHPRGIAEAWADRIPAARLISERPGESPLAWRGGRLSRELAAFFSEPSVRERLAG